MLPPVRVRTAGDEPVPVVDGVHAAIGRAPFLLRPVLTVLSVALLPWLLAPICVVRGVRTLMASLYVAAFWAWLYLLISVNRVNTHASPTVARHPPGARDTAAWLLAMLATPFLVAVLANVARCPSGSSRAARWPGRCCGRCPSSSSSSRPRRRTRCSR